MFRKRAYLDAAAGMTANPSSPHEEGRQARTRLEAARTRIARLLEVKADDVVFTSGATEANALAILGHAAALLRRGRSPHFLYLPTSHASVVENMKSLATHGVAVEPLPVRNGRVDADALTRMLRAETALVSMDAVCGETGIIWNTREVRAALDEARRAPGAERVLLHVDASQAPFAEPMTRSHFGADLLTFDASKISAVRGVGALVAHRTIPLEPLYRGGGQERGVRPGSEAPDLAVAFAAALEDAARERAPFLASARAARSHMVDAIMKGVRDVYIQEGTDAARQAPHILNLSLPGRDTDYLVALLDAAGFAVATRSACETDSEEGSRAVFVLTGDTERAKSTLRISWSPATPQGALSRFPKALQEAVAFVDRGQGG